MRKTALRFAAVAAGIIVFSCSQEILPPVTELEDGIQEAEEIVGPSAETVVFSAVTEGTPSRTTLSDNGDETWSVLWSAGDVIKVNSVNMTIVSPDDAVGYGTGEKKAHFTGTKPSANGSGPKYKALYPSSLRDNYGYYNLPAEQTYEAGASRLSPCTPNPRTAVFLSRTSAA